jgi:predicted NAD/FAD-dependent oxidoreductase
LALLDAGNVQLPLAGRNALETIQYAPCFTVLATLARPSRVPPPGGVQVQGSPRVVWIGDNQQKGVSPHPAVTIHATAEFSRQHFEAPYEQVAEWLLAEAEARGWLDRSAVQTVQVHRWRYAQPTVLHPERYLLLDEPAPLAFAGDAFFEARVEGAALSGTAVAEALAGLPRRR